MPVVVNRAPLLTLWGVVVAERLGYSAETALTLGRAVAGSTAHIQIRSGGAENWKAGSPRPDRATTSVLLLGKRIRMLGKNSALRAAVRPLPAKHGKAVDSYLAANPAAVERYLVNTFGSHLNEVRRAMEELAARHKPAQLNDIGVELYKKFRPEIPRSVGGRGAKAALDVDKILAADAAAVFDRE